MIKNINEKFRVNKMSYIPRIIQVNSYLNATPYPLMVRDLSLVYILRYAGDTMSYSAYYGLRRRI